SGLTPAPPAGRVPDGTAARDADGLDRRLQARPLSALLHHGGSQPAERPQLGLLRLAEPASLPRTERLLADLRGRSDPGQHRAPDRDAAGAARGVRGRGAAGVRGRRGRARRLLARAGDPRPARGRGAREPARRGARPNLYAQGLTDFLTVLVAEESLFTSQ